MSLERRFLNKFSIDSKTGCWNWNACISLGYGRYATKGKIVPAHQYAYTQLIGAIPSGMELHHKCENKRCCNPDHLTPVTRKQHHRLDGRSQSQDGESNPNARITKSDAAIIREMASRRLMRQVDIAEMFGITQSNVSRIKNETWRNTH